jgi:hypothetical protein
MKYLTFCILCGDSFRTARPIILADRGLILGFTALNANLNASSAIKGGAVPGRQDADISP